MTAILVATTSLGTADNASADKKGGYQKNQAVSQANDCGNAEGIPLTLRLTISRHPNNVACENLASQIQGQENEV